MLGAIAFSCLVSWQGARPPQYQIGHEFGGFPFTVVGEYVDKGGSKYQLGKCRVLGSTRDLWIRKLGAFPEFAFSDGGGGHRSMRRILRYHPDITGQDAEKANFYAAYVKKGWHKDADNFSRLLADADADGLTDIVEQRLCTDSNSKDSDKDGINDEVDEMPNAPQRELSDSEQVVALAVTFVRSRELGRGFDIFKAPTGMKPFQMPMQQGPVMWLGQEEDQFPFFYPSFSLEIIKDLASNELTKAEDPSKPWEDQYVIWGENGTTAQVAVAGTYYGMTVHLRKLGDAWVVYKQTHRWIS